VRAGLASFDVAAQLGRAAELDRLHDPNAIDAIRFSVSVAFVWPAMAKPRRWRSRPS
jgi:hypothetical protein